jgi:predicted regulator of Ras-like GTPase activity (Roadblock/LC7/MglB family)
MRELATISKIPNVKSAVLGDLTGGFHDALREQDGETIAAVMGFVASAMAEAGGHLGLGVLSRISISGEARACIVNVHGSSVLTAFIEPAKALAVVERLLDAPAQGKV